MRYYIFSTLTNDHLYTQWTRPDDKQMGPEVIPTPVLIRGGANRATFPDSPQGRHTPKGVVTKVTEAQMEYLKGCWKFQRHVQNGFLIVSTSKDEPETIARDMQAKDNSAPLTPDSAEFNKPEPQKEDVGIVTKALRVMKNGMG